ncbi:MAG: acireductone dioxygenase [Gammaproteobacteria bacterium]|jgi:1,2-dihydroxy-3-keto-5-methylthiopentene dioxygenase
MSHLTIFPDDDPASRTDYAAFEDIARELNAAGIRFERWTANAPLAAGTSQEETIAAYRADVDRLMADCGFQSVDVVSMHPEHPDREALRAKFLDEHTHGEDEVRFFVAGAGLFDIHMDGKVYAVLCERGDLISVPAGTPHWFDMGAAPHFIAIRLFGNPDGWKASFTGSDIAARFPRYGEA